MVFPVKHPKGLWILSIIVIFYDFSFGAITSLLVLYATQKLNLPVSDAYNLSTALFSLLFILPLGGGYISEKMGYKISGITGLLTTLLGTCVLVIPSLNSLYLGIACFAAGNALLTPTTYAMTGLLYKTNSPLRNSGYTLFYLLFNLGFFFSIVLSGFISEINFNYSFAIGGACILIALILFITLFSKIIPAEAHAFKPQLPWSVGRRAVLMALTALLLSSVSLVLLHHVHLNNIVFFLLTLATSLGLLFTAFRQKDPIQRRKILAFLILCIFSVAFWSLYILEPSLVTVFISQNVNRVIDGFTIPATSYYSLDALFVILLGIFFAWLWQFLGRRNKEPSLPTKFSASLLATGSGYLIFVLSIVFADAHTHLANSMWIVLAYAFLATGELLISPIGLSMVGQLMPKGREGLGMGIWQVYIGFSGVIALYLAELAVVPETGLPQATNPVFMHALLKIGLGTFVIGLIMFCLVSKIKRLLEKN